MRVEVAQLGLVQTGRHLGAQRRQAAGIGGQEQRHAAAIAARPALAQRLRQPGVAAGQRGLEAGNRVGPGHRRRGVAAAGRGGGRQGTGHVGPGRDVATGHHRTGGPGALRQAQRRLQQIGGLFGQLAEGGDLAAPHAQQRRGGGVQVQQVVARHGRGVAGFVVQQRPHAAVGPHHVGRRHRLGEVAAGLFAQVIDLRLVDARRADGAVVLDVGGADQREVVFVGDRKDDALVGVLEDVGMVVLEHLLDDDVRALDEPQALAALQVRLLLEELRRPRAGGIDQRTRLHRLQRAVSMAQRGAPALRAALGLGAAGAGVDGGAVLLSIEHVQQHQARIVHPAVGVDEAFREAGLERPAGRMGAQVHGLAAGQHLALGQVVVEEQAGADHPGRAQEVGLGVVRHHEAQRPHDVRRGLDQHLALGQRLAHQRELVVLQVAQPAVDELGGRRGGVLGQVVLLAQHHLGTAARQVACDAGAIDAAADDEHVAGQGLVAGGQRVQGHVSWSARRPGPTFV